VTGHLNSLNRELQDKNKLVTEMSCNIKVFKLRFRLWENQLKVHNIVHFLQFKSVKSFFFFLERIQEYAKRIFLLQEEIDELFKVFTNTQQEFMLFALPLKTDIETVPENLQIELINLQCHTNLIHKFSETKMQYSYSHLPRVELPQVRCLGLRMNSTLGKTHLFEQFFSLMINNKTKSRYGLTDGHM
jgi:hypothetical protein